MPANYDTFFFEIDKGIVFMRHFMSTGERSGRVSDDTAIKYKLILHWLLSDLFGPGEGTFDNVVSIDILKLPRHDMKT